MSRVSGPVVSSLVAVTAFSEHEANIVIPATIRKTGNAQ